MATVKRLYFSTNKVVDLIMGLACVVLPTLMVVNMVSIMINRSSALTLGLGIPFCLLATGFVIFSLLRLIDDALSLAEPNKI